MDTDRNVTVCPLPAKRNLALWKTDDGMDAGLRHSRRNGQNPEIQINRQIYIKVHGGKEGAMSHGGMDGGRSHGTGSEGQRQDGLHATTDGENQVSRWRDDEDKQHLMIW